VLPLLQRTTKARLAICGRWRARVGQAVASICASRAWWPAAQPSGSSSGCGASSRVTKLTMAAITTL